MMVEVVHMPKTQSIEKCPLEILAPVPKENNINASIDIFCTKVIHVYKSMEKSMFWSKITLLSFSIRHFLTV